MERFLTPINLSEVPLLFKTRKLPLDVALIQVSPPDDFGWMSLGVSVDITLPAALNADLVIAQVNRNMPRVLGNSFIHVNHVHLIVEACCEPMIPDEVRVDTVVKAATYHNVLVEQKGDLWHAVVFLDL